MKEGICIWVAVSASMATSTLGCFIIKWTEWGEASEGNSFLGMTLSLYIIGMLGLSWLVFFVVGSWLGNRFCR